MLKTILTKRINPFLLFLPFLLLYLAFVFIFQTNGSFGDESRYLIYARFMIDGYLPADNLNFDYLGNGPGYSIFLIPFVLLKLPLICITILNAVFLYLSVIILFKAANKILSYKWALLIALFWACYINNYEYVFRILPEIFTVFFISILIFSVVSFYESPNSKKYLFLSGFSFGYLALIKPIFGYVLLTLLIALLVFYIARKGSVYYKKAFLIVSLALLTTLPYLIITYNITGKIFYWSTLGGNNLYWATETDEYEYGSWFPDPGLKTDPDAKHSHLKNFEEQVRIKHLEDFNEINKYTGVERDDAYKRMAWKNIKNNPVKYFKNCISNIGRMFFNFPYSYKFQTPKTLVRLPFNGILLIAMLFSLIPAFVNRDKIPFSIKLLMLMAFIYFGGSVLANAETRMFTVIVPVILMWVTYVLRKSCSINTGKWVENNN